MLKQISIENYFYKLNQVLLIHFTETQKKKRFKI